VHRRQISSNVRDAHDSLWTSESVIGCPCKPMLLLMVTPMFLPALAVRVPMSVS
jgi:hypothetical protein